MKLDRFFGELKRRHVYAVLGYYAVGAWVTVEVYTTIQPILWPTAEWTNKLVVVLALLGFPVALTLGWVFDITPHGLQRTPALQQSDPDADASATAHRASQRWMSSRAAGFFGLGILVAIVGLAAYTGISQRPRTSDTGAPVIESIAVLPFADMSPSHDQEFFGDGVAEELLNRLAQVPELRVAARTSSFAFKGRNEDVREIGRQLNVQAVLEGSVRRDGDELRVTAQLIDVATGYHLWSENFPATTASVFDLQDEIAGRIVEVLRLRFAAAPEAGDRGTSNKRASDLYYRGMELWHQRTEPALREALDHFSRATREDTAFALAYASLAQTYAVLPAYGRFPADSAFAQGMAAAAHALSIDPTLAPAFAAMGQLVQNIEWDPRGAVDYYIRALDYNPNYATAHVWYAESLILLGDYDTAAEHVAAALAIDPLSAVSQHADALLETMRGNTEEGLAAWRNLTRNNAEFTVGFLHHAYAALAAGRNDEAIRSLRRLAEAWPHNAPLYNAVIAALGDVSAKPAAVTALHAARLTKSELAAWATVVGETELAIRALQDGVSEHRDVSLPTLLRHPLLAPLRGHPRFPSVD